MGLIIPPIPDDYGAGEDCLHCWPAGKTPNYVFIRFWDIEPCPDCPAPPNGHCFICPQSEINPCVFGVVKSIGGRDWTAYWNCSIWSPSEGKRVSELQLSSPDFLAFFYHRGDECAQDFENELTCEIGWSGEGGHAHVNIYIDPIIIALTSAYHFATIPGVLYEKMECGMDHAIYKLNHRSDKTNVLIYLDKEAIKYE